jgi:hypothetical protein
VITRVRPGVRLCPDRAAAPVRQLDGTPFAF